MFACLLGRIYRHKTPSTEVLAQEQLSFNIEASGYLWDIAGLFRDSCVKVETLPTIMAQVDHSAVVCQLLLDRSSMACFEKLQ
jgi:hypothetical protein